MRTESRDEFRQEFGECFVCGGAWRRSPLPVLDVHEIARGCYRKAAVGQRECWLLVCRMCHDKLGDLSTWPIARQLAVKRIRDAQWYDRIAVNRTRGRADNAVTEEEVQQFVDKLTDGTVPKATDALLTDA